MTATITRPPNSYVSSIRAEGAEHTFESALKGVEQAQRSLLMDRLSARARVHDAIEAAKELERISEDRLNKALLAFHFAGGEPADLGDISDTFPGRLTVILESVSEPLDYEWAC